MRFMIEKYKYKLLFPHSNIERVKHEVFRGYGGPSSFRSPTFSNDLWTD